MKNSKLLFALLALLLVAMVFVACDPYVRYKITTNDDMDFSVTVGEEIDFTEYFTIKTAMGESVPVTADMLDLSAVNMDEEGTFDVKCSYGGATCVATFTVVSSGTQPATFSEIAELYNSYDKWNFVVEYAEISENETVYRETYKYQGDDLSNTYIGYDDNDQPIGYFTDYLQYDKANDCYWYYEDNGDGTYTKYGEETEDYAYGTAYMVVLELTTLNDFEFEEIESNVYKAVDPIKAGNAIMGELTEGYYYAEVAISVENGKISKIKCVCNDGYTYSFTFSGYGTVNFDFSKLDLGGGQGGGIDQPSAFAEIASKYDSYDKWNFVVALNTHYQNQLYDAQTYKYQGDDLSNTYTAYDESDQPIGKFTDYLEYDAQNDCYWYYLDNGDGTYTKYSETDAEFQENLVYMAILELTTLNNFTFNEVDGNTYVAVDAVAVGNEILGELYEGSYVSVTISVASGKIATIEVVCDDGYSYSFEFSGYGTVNLDFSALNGGSQGGGGGVDQPSSLTSTFKDANMGVGKGELEYTASVAPYGFDPLRGLQFTQKNGKTTLTSKSSVDNVTTVTLSVYSNNDASMKVSVSVGSTALLCEGNQVAVPTAKTNVDLVFVADSAVSGQVKITLTPNASKNSMYISKIAINGTSVGGGGGQGGGGTQTGVMEEQVYNPSTFDKRNLQDRMLISDDAIGLPSKGTYNALVIPVQFVDTSISQSQLDDLNKAFNGTSNDTGWESVSSYYKKSSYGSLNVTYDIQPVYNTKQNANYYSSYQKQVNYGGQIATQTGEEIILMEALAYYENILDLTKYDSNNDGCIDAVYLIYSAPVDYDEADFYWAYVTWYYGDEQYDGLDAYYYLFAGFDFMYEDAGANAKGFDYAYEGSLDGLKINASTYIHETGHLLGLDDYYDYEPKKGSNEGLGGADMMDATVGDQGAYSKIMLGWIEPTIVTTTQTITISSLQASGNCILIPLNFNNSYFAEYLLIDLYSAQGLNALHASPNGSYLYDGASFGARIYHVSSEITTPYENDYSSFTENNNTSSTYALIKLVEADGEKKFSSTDGYASQNDLWHTGDVFSEVFANYKRNDGKIVNFDISFVAVSNDSLTVTITFTAQA